MPICKGCGRRKKWSKRNGRHRCTREPPSGASHFRPTQKEVSAKMDRVAALMDAEGLEFFDAKARIEAAIAQESADAT